MSPKNQFGATRSGALADGQLRLAVVRTSLQMSGLPVYSRMAASAIYAGSPETFSKESVAS